MNDTSVYRDMVSPVRPAVFQRVYREVFAAAEGSTGTITLPTIGDRVNLKNVLAKYAFIEDTTALALRIAFVIMRKADRKVWRLPFLKTVSPEDVEKAMVVVGADLPMTAEEFDWSAFVRRMREEVQRLTP